MPLSYSHTYVRKFERMLVATKMYLSEKTCRFAFCVCRDKKDTCGSSRQRPRWSLLAVLAGDSASEGTNLVNSVRNQD